MSRLTHVGDSPDVGELFHSRSLFSGVVEGHISSIVHSDTRTFASLRCVLCSRVVPLNLMCAAGRVSLSECKNLSDTLKMMPGGSTFLPFSCSALISHDEKTMADRFEQQNAKVYKSVSQIPVACN